MPVYGVRPLLPFLAFGAYVVTIACDNPAGPTLPGPTISCPAALTVPSPAGTAVAVTYPAPMVTGGKAPVAATCTPPSGSSFPIGSTSVSCTATDADRRVAACSFLVSVTPPPRLSATRFTAFGDSVTHGIASRCGTTLRPYSLESFLLELRAQAVHGDDSASYPRKLEGFLRQRYTAQLAVVVNEGAPGETIDMGAARLPGVLAREAPQILLLQEGVNGLNGPVAVTQVIAGLRTMIREASPRGVRVFLGTLLPVIAQGCRGGAADWIVATNAQIRTLAASEGAVLVDLYGAFAGMPGLIGIDGLHPTDAGYEKMAQTFFEVIRQRLEQQSVAGNMSVVGLSFSSGAP